MASPTLLGSLVARFAGSSILGAAVPNGCYVGREPETAPTKPFVILTHEGEIAEWDTERGVDEDTDVIFHVFDVTAESVESIALKIKNRFDWGAGYDLLITGATTTDVSRTNFVLTPLEMRDENGKVVHHGQVAYKVRIHRTPSFDA